MSVDAPISMRLRLGDRIEYTPVVYGTASVALSGWYTAKDLLVIVEQMRTVYSKALADSIREDLDDCPGCPGCGAMAGCCSKYPECPGNSSWTPPADNEQTVGRE